MLRLIVLSGLPGSGKSTVAKAIASELHLPIYSVDPMESAIIKAGFDRSFKTGLAAYLVAETLADEQLSLGQTVIIDAANYVREAQEMWIKLANKHGAELKVIACICANETQHQERIAKRVRALHGIPEITWSDVEKRKVESTPWQTEHVVLDTNRAFNATMHEALKYISA
ncbi:ATP-binding protein [bacterium]|nr:MAG: ATP-binding protein [bacterium]